MFYTMHSKWPSWLVLLAYLGSVCVFGDEKYNVLHEDGSFEFGYDTPDSFHFADGNRNNVVQGQFGARNPKTGVIDKTTYTAGPRGFRPRGKNVVRKYDLNQNGPRAIGSRDDPYYDPYEDPSYSFSFRTRNYNREENANRVGDVTGSYSYLDDVGERHDVQFIAGKNTGFHVKTPFPDSNPRGYGPLYFNGRGKPIPRGRTAIQRGLDGSYRFISAGPDQRRTETSDSTGHVRGSYTYLDDKGVQHSVHYIAGPETGYRVLKNVKGPQFPSIYPFGRPDIIPPDFYDPFDKSPQDVFDTAATKHPKPFNNNRNTYKPNQNSQNTDNSNLGDGFDVDKDDYDKFKENVGGSTFGSPTDDNTGSTVRPISGGRKPSGGGRRIPNSGAGKKRPVAYDYDDGNEDVDPFANEGGNRGSSTSKPFVQDDSGLPYDDGSYKPSGEDGSYKSNAGNSGFKTQQNFNRPTSRRPPVKPKPGVFNTEDDDVGDGDNGDDDFGLFDSARPTSSSQGTFGSTSRPQDGFGTITGNLGDVTPTLVPDRTYSSTPEGLYDSPGDGDGNSPYNPTGEGIGTPSYDSGRKPPVIGVSGGNTGTGRDTFDERGTIVTNLGDRVFSVPPGVSVRAHVQAIDLLPLGSRTPLPSEQFKAETSIRTEQLNEAVQNSTIASTTEISATTDDEQDIF